MSDAYADWIARFLAEHNGSVRGLCASASMAMKAAFPELAIVRGFHCPGGPHWWLTAPDGTIVDPTASQFPKPGAYRPFRPGDIVQVGRCMNCGEEIYEKVQSLDGSPKCVCSPECALELDAEYNDDPKDEEPFFDADELAAECGSDNIEGDA